MSEPSPRGAVRDYPRMAVEVDTVEPVPRRVRGFLAGRPVFDTARAQYLWEWRNYPQYYIPLADVVQDYLVDEGHSEQLRHGTALRYGLRVGDKQRPGAARVYAPDAHPDVAGTVRFAWDALDSWFEEDEEVFVHPRNPYVRVDALRSHRSVRVELGGVMLADTHSPVLLFETGLPTRYYIDRTDVRFEHLVPSDTRTPCPYKGNTSGYWSLHIGDVTHDDLAWAYDFPTEAVRPITGMIAFFNEKVDIYVDGELLERPRPTSR
ncbi:MAG: DUF427 domain-containing protein [Nocardioidaceae bacterium]